MDKHFALPIGTAKGFTLRLQQLPTNFALRLLRKHGFRRSLILQCPPEGESLLSTPRSVHDGILQGERSLPESSFSGQANSPTLESPSSPEKKKNTDIQTTDSGSTTYVHKSRLFDRDYYIKVNKDIASAGIDAYTHYRLYGFREGRNPNPYFNTNHYLGQNPDVAESGIEPFHHYSEYGHKEPLRSPTLHSGPGGYGLSQFPWREQLVHALPQPSGKDVAGACLFTRPTLGVHVHSFFEDITLELIQKLKTLRRIDILVVTISHSNDTKQLEDLIVKILGTTVLTTKIIRVPNVGRDVAPLFIDALPHLLRCDVLLHIHTKKSKEKPKIGEAWRKFLLSHLVGSPSQVSSILDLFSSQPKLGLLSPPPYPGLPMHRGWGANKAIAEKLLRIVAIKEAQEDLCEPDAYPVGFMFWARPSALLPLYESGLSYSDFPREPLPEDGSLAHAIERLLPQIASIAGYHTRQIHLLPFATPVRRRQEYDVSIIIPAHNAENTISQTIQTIFAQIKPTYSFEIIIVHNDCSDKTSEIAHWYSSYFGNVRTLSADGAKAGGARNVGLRAAKGAYIIFVDADDIVPNYALELLLSEAQRTDSDLVCSQLQMFDENSIGRPLPHYSSRIFFEDFDGLLGSNLREPEAKALEHLKSLVCDFGPCAKIYKRSFLLGNDIFFPADRHYEDNPFIYLTLSRARRVLICPESTYYYRKFTSRKGKTESSKVSSRHVADFILSTKEAAMYASLTKNRTIRTLMRGALMERVEVQFSDSKSVFDMKEREALKLEINGILGEAA